jgi:hypothetical protein
MKWQKSIVPRAILLHITSGATFDIVVDTDSPASLDYCDLVPFRFNGKIGTTRIGYTDIKK